MEEKLRPIIKDKKIINLQDILLEIKDSNEKELLSDFNKEVKDFAVNNNIDGLSELSLSLSNRLKELNKTLENTKDNLKEKELLSITKSANLVSKLYENIPLSLEEINALHTFMFTGIKNMQEEELSFENQNAIDTYIVYLETKENIDILTSAESYILSEYRTVIKKREEKLQIEEIKNNDNIKKLSLVPTELNTTGTVVTIVILEVTLLLGVLISVIALVKR